MLLNFFFSCYDFSPTLHLPGQTVPRVCHRKGKMLNISNVECCQTDFCNVELKPTLATYIHPGMVLVYKMYTATCMSTSHPLYFV